MQIESAQGPAALAAPAALVRRRWTERHEDELAERWFALQTHAGIGRDMGWSPRAVVSKAHFLNLPPRHAFALHDDFLPERRTVDARLSGRWGRLPCGKRRWLRVRNRASVIVRPAPWPAAFA